MTCSYIQTRAKHRLSDQGLQDGSLVCNLYNIFRSVSGFEEILPYYNETDSFVLAQCYSSIETMFIWMIA